MAETNVVGPVKGIYYALEGSGPPVVAAAMTWNSPVAEVQTVTITGTPTGGTFKLTYQGVPGTPLAQETGAIAFDSTAAAMELVVEALAGIGATEGTCAGGDFPAAAVTVTFSGALADLSIHPFKPTSMAFTGGTNVKVAVTRTTPGSAGWTEIETVPETGAEISFVNEGVDREEAGRWMPVEFFDTKMGMTSIKFQAAASTEAYFDLAMPDGDTTGSTLYGGATRSYIALAVHTDNCVWWAPRCSAVGVPAVSYVNPDFTKVPFEFKVYENPYAAAKTSNWVRYPIT